MSDAPPVAVLVVSRDAASDLPACLAAVGALRHRPLEVVLVDCASSDGSVEIARRNAPADLDFEVVALAENLGFAGGMNRGIAATTAPYLLSLNPDALPEPAFVGRLLERFARHADELRVGAVTGRLVRPVAAGEPPRLDACGMRLTLTWRHLDRGAGAVDKGQWALPERVFGATGAATLFRREALADVALDGEVFAEEFHSFREDAELCFRLRERGWDVLYEPAALCTHRRTVTPGRRRRLPAAVNFHSLKNRYLLRAYHQTLPNLLLTAPTVLARDLAALAYVLLRERSSLAAYRWLWRRRRAILARRREIQARRTVGRWPVERWFLRQGIAL